MAYQFRPWHFLYYHCCHPSLRYPVILYSSNQIQESCLEIQSNRISLILQEFFENCRTLELKDPPFLACLFARTNVMISKLMFSFYLIQDYLISLFHQIFYIQYSPAMFQNFAWTFSWILLHKLSLLTL